MLDWNKKENLILALSIEIHVGVPKTVAGMPASITDESNTLASVLDDQRVSTMVRNKRIDVLSEFFIRCTHVRLLQAMASAKLVPMFIW